MYDINILPPKLRKKKKKIKIGNPTYAPFLLIAVLGTSFFMNQQLDSRIQTAKEEQNAVIQEIRKIEPELMRVSSIVSEIDKLKAEFQKKETLTSSGTPWDTVLDEISSVIPPEVTIIAIEEGTEPGMIKLDAKTVRLTNMAKTKESIEKNPHFTNVKIPDFKANTSFLSRPQEVTFSVMLTYQENPNTGANPTDSGMTNPSDGTVPNTTGIEPNVGGETNTTPVAPTPAATSPSTGADTQQGGGQ